MDPARSRPGDSTETPGLTRRALLLVAVLACHHGEVKHEAAHGLRVVSLSPSTTEAVAAEGGLDLLVGRSRYCDYPPAVTKLPEVGGYVDPNIEAIVALHPDLVVGARGPAGRQIDDTLRARHIETYFPPDETIPDILAMVRGVGAHIGHAREAEELATRIQKQLDEVSDATRTLDHPRVLLLFGTQPVVAAGPKSFGDELLSHAGARNAVASGSTYPNLDIEAVVALDPDVIVDAAAGEGHGAQHLRPTSAGWGHVRAVREGHVVELSDEALLRPGPRIADAVSELARAIRQLPGMQLYGDP